LHPDFGRWDYLQKAQWLEMSTLLQGYILSSQGDRMLMAHSVEGRFPYLDHTLVEALSTIPSQHKILGLREKHLLKTAFRETIPRSIIDRPKQPYRAPDNESFFGSREPEWIASLVSESSLKNQNIFDGAKISRLVSKCRNAKGRALSNTDNMRIVGVLSALLTNHIFVSNNLPDRAHDDPPEPFKIIDVSDRSMIDSRG
jgi:asparagine synthase (glutamine-hydrolysing)